MRSIKFGTGFTVFILFFGISLLDAFQTANYTRALFWVAMGLMFFTLDNIPGRRAN